MKIQLSAVDYSDLDEETQRRAFLDLPEMGSHGHEIHEVCLGYNFGKTVMFVCGFLANDAPRPRPVANVFLVVGSVGEYDDYEQWVVAAWPTQEEADQHAADARSEVSRIENERVRQRLPNHVMNTLVGREPWCTNAADPRMESWGNVLPSYHVEDVPLSPAY